MGYSIEGNYSVLNNYTYKDKSSVMSALDWLSTPCRRVFGGRNVNVLDLTYEHPMSTGKKVAVVFFSILIAPIAVVSIVSLLIKAASMPWFWQKKNVYDQTRQTWQTIEAFNSAYDSKNFDQAIQIIKQNPAIIKKTDINSKFWEIVTQKVNNNCSWDEIAVLFRYLNRNEQIGMLNHAIATKLSLDYKNGINSITGEFIIKFTGNLGCKNTESQESFYIKQFSSALRIYPKDDPVFNAIKMDIADTIVQNIIDSKKSHAKNRMEVLFAESQDTTYRLLIGSESLELQNILRSPNDMRIINRHVNNLREMNLIGSKVLKELNDAASQPSKNPEEKWNAIQQVLSFFHSNLNSLPDLVTQEEQDFVAAMQRTIGPMIKLTKDLSSASTGEDVEVAVETAYNTYQQSIVAGIDLELIKKLNRVLTPSNAHSSLENLVLLLRLKRSESLLNTIRNMIVFIEKSPISVYQNAS